jgi:AcrR family transcriptional regulator
MNNLEKPIVKKIMGAARNLFFRYGTSKVSIEEICRDAGVSKMSFYRHFKNKDDIRFYVLRKHFTDRMNEYEGILNQDIPFEDKLKKILYIKMENVKNISDEMLNEILTEKDSMIGKWLTEQNIKEIEKIREFINSAQAKGEIRSDVRVELVLFMIERTWGLLSDNKLLEIYESKAQMLKELNAILFYGILSRNNE